jgi:uncharacterized membrane protein YeaQ/YmgE (transglycosylase-associated protein family)
MRRRGRLVDLTGRFNCSKPTKNMNLLWFILIGLVAGFLAGAVMKGHGFGLLGNLIVGVIGALLGGFLLGLLGIYTAGVIGSLISAFLGAVVLLVLIGFIKRKGG